MLQYSKVGIRPALALAYHAEVTSPPSAGQLGLELEVNGGHENYGQSKKRSRQTGTCLFSDVAVARETRDEGRRRAVVSAGRLGCV